MDDAVRRALEIGPGSTRGIKAARGGEFDLEDWLARSPLVELTFDDPA